MADDDQQEPRRPRRPRRKAEADGTPSEHVEQELEAEDRRNGGTLPAQVAARRAAQHVADFTGRAVETVVAVDRADGGWKVGVEVVETQRIPDTQDVLAIYEVRVDRGGDLLSYRRTGRYPRGRMDGGC